MIEMGTNFECGCRVSGAWYPCKKHEAKLIEMITDYENKFENTVSDIVTDKKGNTLRYENERPMKDAK